MKRLFLWILLNIANVNKDWKVRLVCIEEMKNKYKEWHGFEVYVLPTGKAKFIGNMVYISSFHKEEVAEVKFLGTSFIYVNGMYIGSCKASKANKFVANMQYRGFIHLKDCYT